MNDSYELIRRYAVEYVEKNCNPELLSAWIESYLLRGHETAIVSESLVLSIHSTMIWL